MLYKDTKVWWYDGLGRRHDGIVQKDVPNNEHMIPVITESGNIISIEYDELHSISSEQE